MCQNTTVERMVKSQTGMPHQWLPKAMCLEQQNATGIESTSETADPLLDEFGRNWNVCWINEYMNEWMNETTSVPTKLPHCSKGRVGFSPFELKGCWLGLMHSTGWCKEDTQKLRENLRINQGDTVEWRTLSRFQLPTHGFSSSCHLFLGSIGVNEGLLCAKQYTGHYACNHGWSLLSKSSGSSERDKLENSLFQFNVIHAVIEIHSRLLGAA